MSSAISGRSGRSCCCRCRIPRSGRRRIRFFYDLDITLSNGVSKVDSVTSYFGMRKISLGTTNGFVKMLLNNQFVFSSARWIRVSGPMAFTRRRPTTHSRATSSRPNFWLQHGSQTHQGGTRPLVLLGRQIGILVWQDMPSANSYTGNPQPLIARV